MSLRFPLAAEARILSCNLARCVEELDAVLGALRSEVPLGQQQPLDWQKAVAAYGGFADTSMTERRVAMIHTTSVADERRYRIRLEAIAARRERTLRRTASL